MGIRLIITEKPSVGQAVAAVLGAKKRGDGFMEGNDVIVSWCIGHLVGMAQADTYDEKYGKWRYADLPIIPDEWKYIVAPDKKKQLKTLSTLMNRKDVDTIICATDAGREGELIFRLVYEYCKCEKPVQRLWISSMEESAIAEGFQNLRPGSDYEKLYQSALARSQADWIVGINATRLFSSLYRNTLNIGRVQTPTLAMLVEREAEIAAFFKEALYTPELDCGFVVSGEKTKDKAAAVSIRAACDGKAATVKSVERREKTTTPPKLYDLTTLQREANRLYGYTAQQTLDYVQTLYEKKLCTYPRTDSRYLTEDMAAGIPALVSAVAAALPFAKGLSVPVNAAAVINNAKVSDHHAIIPTPTMPKTDVSSLPVGERAVLYMISARLLCAVGEKQAYAETTITVECEKYIFTAKGKTILRDGWRAFEQAFRATLKEKPKDDSEDETDNALPEVSEGQSFQNVPASVREGFTSPKKSYTEDTLLKAMELAGAEDAPEDAERKGLGTPATRAGIIEKLVKTGFMERKGKQLLPTSKGKNLIVVVPNTIKSPMLTAEWEHKLKQIEHGELPATDFMTGIVAMTMALVKAHTAPLPEHADKFSPFKQGVQIGKCPRCGAPVRESGKGFFCESRACGFALWKDARFFTAKKKTLTKDVATKLLATGRASMTGLYSEKSGKTYDAVVVLVDTGSKYANFKLDFESKKGAKK